ncbi:protein of unknown function [Cohaesibacter marisflavi]|uniref:DUF4386 domain-containing protein n=1 Tax=Cohaesibacter marisflavi TaxID=655353 RepID=A0A1I5KZK2_9HYPH|nr:DUF4386 domain-containing protein [Cohaesibacter marisflavi]SFO90332.1 protein of unknown function [Cohaesibacter marisflavi]
MSSPPHQTQIWRMARAAGCLYVAIILLGLSAELGIRSQLIQPDDTAATVSAILAHGGLFRLGLAADLVMALSDAGLALLFFFMFRATAPALALSAMVFRLLQTGVIAVNLLNLQAAWLLINGFSGSQATMAMQFLLLHGYGYDLGLLFFGVNGLLMAALIWQSRLFSRVFAVGLGVAGVVYLTGSGLRFLVPDLADNFEPAYGIPILAESLFCIRLLIGSGFASKRLGREATPHAAEEK